MGPGKSKRVAGWGAIKEAPGSILTFSAVKDGKWRKRCRTDPGDFRADTSKRANNFLLVNCCTVWQSHGNLMAKRGKKPKVFFAWPAV